MLIYIIVHVYWRTLLYYIIVIYLCVHMGAARPCSMFFIYFICLKCDIIIFFSLFFWGGPRLICDWNTCLEIQQSINSRRGAEWGHLDIVHSNLTHLTYCFFVYNIEKHVRFDNNAINLSISTKSITSFPSMFTC